MLIRPLSFVTVRLVIAVRYVVAISKQKCYINVFPAVLLPAYYQKYNVFFFKCHFMLM